MWLGSLVSRTHHFSFRDGRVFLELSQELLSTATIVKGVAALPPNTQHRWLQLVESSWQSILDWDTVLGWVVCLPLPPGNR